MKKKEARFSNCFEDTNRESKHNLVSFHCFDLWEIHKNPMFDSFHSKTHRQFRHKLRPASEPTFRSPAVFPAYIEGRRGGGGGGEASGGSWFAQFLCGQTPLWYSAVQ